MPKRSAWTPSLDLLLRDSARDGVSYAEIARLVSKRTGGRFWPHPTTCYRRLVALDAEASPRVDVAKIPARRRAPLGERLAPPGVLVLAMPAQLSDRHPDGCEGAMRDVLSALPPGWSYSFDFDAWRDAVASAQHQATKRGEQLVVIEEGSDFVAPLVSVGTPGARGKLLYLVAARFTK